MAFSPLPIVDWNRNPLDVSPLTDAIDKRNVSQQRQQALDMDKTRLGFEKNRLAMDEKRFGLEQDRFRMQSELHPIQVRAAQQGVEAGDDEATRRKAGQVATFVQERFLDPTSPSYLKDPAVRAANWPKMLETPMLKGMSYLNDPELGPLFRDPELGPKMLASIASGYQSPLAKRKAEADIGKDEAQAALYKAQAEAAGRKGVGYENLKQVADVTEGMRKEFTALPVVKNYIDAQSASDRLRSLVGNAEGGKFGSGAGDIAMVFSFIKALDPTSVVQPGEQATARNAPGVSDQLLNTYNRLLTGQFLTPQTRSDFIKVIDSELEHRKAPAIGLGRRYRTIARETNINPDHVVERVFGGVDLDGDGRPDNVGGGPPAPRFNAPPRPGQPGTGGQRPAGAQQGSKDNPVPLRSPTDANGLPSGTFFTTPDGRLMQRP